MTISMTKDVQEKLEHNKNLLAQMHNVVSKLQRSDRNSRNVSILSSNVSVAREGNLRVYFTKDKNNNVVILDVAEKRNF